MSFRYHLIDLEFIQICRAVGLGFVIMGLIGYMVKLIHIPINNIVCIHAH